MQTANWAKFDSPDTAFDYSDADLKKNWAKLHTGDCEPYPSDSAVLKAWQAYHRGDFAEAVDLATEIGEAAHVVANKASGIYADYLEEDEETKKSIYQQGIERAEAATGSAR